MPFYSPNIPAGNVTEATTPGFAQPIREHRFSNTVWQQAPGPTDTTTMSEFSFFVSLQLKKICETEWARQPTIDVRFTNA